MVVNAHGMWLTGANLCIAVLLVIISPSWFLRLCWSFVALVQGYLLAREYARARKDGR